MVFFNWLSNEIENSIEIFNSSQNENTDYVNLNKIKKELDKSKKIFRKNQWPIIDVTRKSVEETAASIIKIYEIKNKKND